MSNDGGGLGSCCRYRCGIFSSAALLLLLQMWLTSAAATFPPRQVKVPCDSVHRPKRQLCTGCPPMLNGKLCASTTRYNDQTKAACGCGNSEPIPKDWWTLTHFTAAQDCKSLDTKHPLLAWCPRGCGACYRLCSTGGSMSDHRPKPAGVCRVFKITNRCGDGFGEYNHWCSNNFSWAECQDDPASCKEMSNTNSFGYPAHFDLQDFHFQVSKKLDWDNVEVTFEQVSCTEWDGPDWDCHCNSTERHGGGRVQPQLQSNKLVSGCDGPRCGDMGMVPGPTNTTLSSSSVSSTVSAADTLGASPDSAAVARAAPGAAGTPVTLSLGRGAANTASGSASVSESAANTASGSASVSESVSITGMLNAGTGNGGNSGNVSSSAHSASATGRAVNGRGIGLEDDLLAQAPLLAFRSASIPRQSAPAAKPQPTLQPVPQPMPLPVPQLTPQPMQHPMLQPVPQPMPQPMTQPMPQPVLQPMPHPVTQPMPQSAAQSTPQSTAQSAQLPVPQPAAQPRLQPLPQPLPPPSTGGMDLLSLGQPQSPAKQPVPQPIVQPVQQSALGTPPRPSAVLSPMQGSPGEGGVGSVGSAISAARGGAIGGDAGGGHCAKEWEQCGGRNHRGPTCCELGCSCSDVRKVHGNDPFFTHQCVPRHWRGCRYGAGIVSQYDALAPALRQQEKQGRQKPQLQGDVREGGALLYVVCTAGIAVGIAAGISLVVLIRRQATAQRPLITLGRQPGRFPNGGFQRVATRVSVL